MEKTVITKSSEETQEVGEELAKDLTKGTVLLLIGELGSGKTTFVQGLAKGLGITRRIISPTFPIIRSHAVPSNVVSGKNATFLYHIDLYRVTGEKEMESLGLEELLETKDSIVVIEWPEKLKKVPSSAMEIHFRHLTDTDRELVLTTV